MAVKFQPESYHTVTPYLIVDGAAKAIEFYTRCFGAEEVLRMPSPGGKVGHAELSIGDSRIMLADEHPDMGYRGPKAFGGAAVSIMLYVKDADKMVQIAVDAGAKLVKPLQDHFYGDRSGQIEDPYGHVWTISTHIEDVSEEEMAKRIAAFGKQ